MTDYSQLIDLYDLKMDPMRKLYYHTNIAREIMWRIHKSEHSNERYLKDLARTQEDIQECVDAIAEINEKIEAMELVIGAQKHD